MNRCLLIAAVLTVPILVAADDSAPTNERIRFFETNVRPALVEHCFRFHGPDRQKVGLRLDSPATMFAGGDSETAVIAGKPDENLLVNAINYTDYEIPPDGKLSDENIAEAEYEALLDDLLVVRGGEFGRYPVSQGGNGGRDHNPNGFTYWMAGGGVKGGTSYGETDELGHEAAVNRHHIRDLQATILHLMGLDHHKLKFFYGGLDQKLTGVMEANVIHGVVA